MDPSFRSGRVSRRAILLAALVPATASLLGKASQTQTAMAEVALADFGGSPRTPDNSAALRAALSALRGKGGGVLRLGPGTYRFASATIGRGGIILPSGVTLCGAGHGKTILAITGNATCNFLVAINSGAIAIEDLAIIGNNVAMAGATIYGSGAAIRWLLDQRSAGHVSGFSLRRVHLENFRGPYWVDVENATSRDRAHEMHDIAITDLTFRSLPGNCAGGDDIRLNSAVVGINGFSGTIRGIEIARFSGDARHIKTGIILYHAVTGAVLDRVTIAGAGRDGARDDAGAYAIQLYDSFYRMRDITVSAASLTAPRSVGIYVAGGTDIKIVDPVISGQTDQRDATLPKGAIVFNGTRRWSVQGGTLRGNWRDIEIAAPPEGSAENPSVIGGRILGVRAEGSDSGIVIGQAAGHVARDIAVRDCIWRTRARAVLVRNSAARTGGGYIDDIVFENCSFDAGAGSRAIDLWGTSGSPAGGYVIERCKLSGTNPLFARDFQGSLRVAICTIRDLGTMAGTAAASLLNCPKLDLQDCTFESPGPDGVGVNLAGSQGSLRGLRFTRCTRNLPATATPPQLGRERPRFVGRTGQEVQNLEPGLGKPLRWRNVAGTRWVDN